MQKHNANSVLLYGTCLNAAVAQQYSCVKSKIHKAELLFDPLVTPIESVICTCHGPSRPVAKKILPTAVNTKEVLIYNNCLRTLLASSYRQAKAMPAMSKSMMVRWYKFCDKVFATEIIPMIAGFRYSYNHWYNHLSRNQQVELIRVNLDMLDKYVYSNFTKREVQEDESKARNISAPNVEVKYVMGPVVWQLEHIFKCFHGYCGPKTYEELASYYAQCQKLGYDNVAQGDGTSFDLCQTWEAKYIDRLIYNYIADNGLVTHVDNETFRSVSCRRYRDLKLSMFIDGKTQYLGKITLDGTVGSGAPDTTFGNTLRMSMYNRFVFEEILGLTKNDYGLLTKGDDFVAMYSGSLVGVEEAYYKFFLSPSEFNEETDDRKEIKSGQILKFLNIGDYESIDFCSTAVINRGGHMVVVRKVDRIVSYGHYSIKALHYDKYDLYLYYLATADCIKAWSGDIPLYSDYAKIYELYAKRIASDNEFNLVTLSKRKALINTPKLMLPVNEKFRDDDSHNYFFGRDHWYAMKERVQSVKIPHNLVWDFLLDKYGLCKATVELHIDKLKIGSVLYDEISGAI